MRHCARVARDFVAFFGQMPTIVDFHAEAIAHGLRFLEHVTWVKRKQNPTGRLSRSHESIFIYAAGKESHFYKKRGNYEDVALPGVMFDVVTIDAIKSHISDLHAKINNPLRKGIPVDTGCQSLYRKRFAFSSDRSPRECNFTNVWSFLPPANATKGTSKHPTEKPTEVMERLIEMLTPEGGSVLDPTMGSGTTGVASVKLGRNFIGIENNADYFEMSQRRIEAERGFPVYAETDNAEIDTAWPDGFESFTIPKRSAPVQVGLF